MFDPQYSLRSMAVDEKIGRRSVAVDGQPGLNSNALGNSYTDNKNVAVDTIAVDSIAVDPAFSSAYPNVDPKARHDLSAYGPEAVEVDGHGDDGSFHIDLSAFRSTTRMRASQR